MRTASAVPSYQPLLLLKFCSAAKISTNPLLKTSKIYVLDKCWCKETELNWVKMKICLNPALIQLEIGMSTNLYFPPNGTAGFDLTFVNG